MASKKKAAKQKKHPAKSVDAPESKKLSLSKKKMALLAGGGIAALLIVYIIHSLFQKPQGPLEMGICRIFAEQRLVNPQTFCLTSVDYLNVAKAYRIYYTYIGAYGEFNSHITDCVFKPEGENGWPALARARIGRHSVPDGEIANFNKSIPSIVASEPDLEIPAGAEGLTGLRAKECMKNF